MKKILEKIGLSDKEAQIYLLGLSSLRPTAQFFSKKSGINRSSIYDILSSLTQKGLVAKCVEERNTYYRVLPPDELTDYLERNRRAYENDIAEKKHIIKEHLTELKSLQNINTTKPRVKFFEGELGMREAYEDTLSSHGEILAFANVEVIHQTLPHFFPEYYKRRKNKGIPIRAIFPNNQISLERAKVDQEEMRETKIIDEKKYGFSPEINIYDNKMLIVSWKERMAITIESQEIVECFRNIYHLLWEHIPRSNSKK